MAPDTPHPERVPIQPAKGRRRVPRAARLLVPDLRGVIGFRTLDKAAPPQQSKVAVVDLSETGARLRLDHFIHIGTKCILALPSTNDAPSALNATVVRCVYVSGNGHDVGLQFAEAINVADYTDPDQCEEVKERLQPPADRAKAA